MGPEVAQLGVVAVRARLRGDDSTTWKGFSSPVIHHTVQTFEARLDSADRGEGRTLFDQIVDIIRGHGPGGDESEGGIRLELL